LGKAFIAPMKKTIENLESFIRDATHEMNTPISVILTNVETLGDTENKSLKRIKNAALRLNKIFEDLKFLRLNAKKRIKKIDLEAFLKERLKNFETAKENKKISLKLETEKCFVKFDEEDLNRLIDNVLSNAFKYAPAFSEVSVFLKECRFCVENEGKITNPEKIKEKFYRENEIEGGFGLGLYIVDKICERYSLRLEIKNLQNKVSICVNF
jgi:two-component system OmpR family sensor kinase